MRFLQVGLGSMGKRRIRCLKRLGFADVTGFDPREDRRKEAAELHGIHTAAAIKELDLASFDAFVISTPPDRHMDYMKLAVAHGKPAFIEASVALEGLRELDAEARAKGVLLAPSCTLRFHPAIKEIARIVAAGRYGKVTNFSHHCGQHLRDWHPWEDPRDYYVSKKETGACREIVPFELTWLAPVVGHPRDVRAFRGRTMDVGADIDDTYVLALKYEGCYGSLVVDVVSRHAVRSLILNMERGQILWRWDVPKVDLYDAETKQWAALELGRSKAHDGYNQNIGEEMYIEELGAFTEAAGGKGRFPNTLEDDIKVLEILYKAENGHGTIADEARTARTFS